MPSNTRAGGVFPLLVDDHSPACWLAWGLVGFGPRAAMPERSAHFGRLTRLTLTDGLHQQELLALALRYGTDVDLGG